MRGTLLVTVCLCLLLTSMPQAKASEGGKLLAAYLIGGGTLYAASKGNWVATGIGAVATGALLKSREDQIRARHRYEAPGYSNQGPEEACCAAHQFQSQTRGHGITYVPRTAPAPVYVSAGGRYGPPSMVSVTETTTYYIDRTSGSFTEVQSVTQTVRYGPPGPPPGSYSYATY